MLELTWSDRDADERGKCDAAMLDGRYVGAVILLVGILGFLLGPLLALMLGRVCNPNPPKDGTSGPWCAVCRYPLAGLAAEVACPECGGSGRMVEARGVGNRGRWAARAFGASLVSHVPVYVLWTAHLSDVGLGLFALGVLIVEAGIVALTIAILAGRVQRGLLLTALLVLTGAQFITDSVCAIWQQVEPPTEYHDIVYAVAPVMGMIVSPVAFDAFAVGAMVWVWSRRKR